MMLALTCLTRDRLFSFHKLSLKLSRILDSFLLLARIIYRLHNKMTSDIV